MFEGKITSSGKLSIARQMRVCLSAGMTPASMLITISKDPGLVKIKKNLLKASESVFDGKPLSEALKKAALNELGLFFICFIQIAEQTGSYDQALNQLEKIYQGIFHISEKIRAQLFFPKISLLLLIFQVLLVSFNDFILLFFIFCGPVLVWFTVPAAYTSRLKKELLLVTPYIGKVLKKFYSALFLEVISLVISSGTSFARARMIVWDLFDFRFMKKDIDRIFNSLESGNSISDSFSKANFLDKNTKSAFHIGQESGSTDSALSKASDLAMKHLLINIDTALSLSSRFFLTFGSAITGFACYRLITAFGKNLEFLV
jgi:type II secretory pathway component PulF